MEEALLFGLNILSHKNSFGIDVQQRQDSQYFRRYTASRGLQRRISPHWATDQGNSGKLCEIIKAEFAGPLDLVIDGASHMYVLTKKSFETVSPLLRPGGVFTSNILVVS